MSVGSEYTFFIPSELAYGPQDAGFIPANSVLVFDVKLLDVKHKDVKAESKDDAKADVKAESKDDAKADAKAESKEDAKDEKLPEVKEVDLNAELAKEPVDQPAK